MIGAKITRNGDIYVPRFEEGFSSLLDEGVVGEFHTTLDLLNVNSKERIAPLSGHVATLIPGGGVAVTVGTTNLVSDPENWIPNTNEHQDTISTGEKFLGCAVAKTIKKTGSTPPSTLIYLSSIAPGETYTASIYVKHLPDVIENARLIFYKESKLASAYAKGTGDWERLEVTYTNNTGSTLEGVYVYYYPAKNQGSITFTAAPQVEKLGFATPVTKGTRPRGILSYPVINSGTEMAVIIKASKPELLQPTGSHHLLALFSDVNAPYPDTFVLFAENGVNELRFRTRDSEGLSQNDVIITNCWDDKEHMVVAYMNHNPASGRHKKELYFDGELVGYSDPSGMPDLSKAVDTRLGHWDGTAFWGSPISLFSIIDTCTPEFIYNISKSKARLSPKGFFIPGGMEEKHTITFDKAGYFASFNNDLLIRNKIHPTDSIKPNGLDGATKTDYGLIYNTNGNLCATLLPEGGVAVTEGTTNLVTNQSSWNTRNGAVVTRELVTSGQWAGWYRVRVTRTGTRNYIGNIENVPVANGTTHTWSIDFYSETGKTYLTGDGTYGIGRLTHISGMRHAITWTNNRGASGNVGIYFAHSDGAEIDVDEVFYYRRYQVEAQPYDTPYVEGTRPAGALSYNLPISINGDWTIAKWLELEPYFMDKSYSGDKPIGKYRLPLLELGKTYYTEGHGTLGIYGAWLGSQPGKTIRIVANKDQAVTYSSDAITLTEAEYNNKILAVLTKSGAMLTAYIYTVGNKYVLTRDIASLGDISQIAPQLNYHTVTTGNRMYCKRHLNTLVCPYAVSPETVEAWHNNPVKIGATLKTKGELKEFCPYVLNKGYFAPLNHGLAFIDLATENKFIKPLGME